MQTQNSTQLSVLNTIVHGDCIQAMREMPANSVDFILTDPPYLVNFRDRTGRRLQNDTNADWLKPAMAGAHRVLKQNRLMLCFYGWPRADKFLEAWRNAGFRPVGHLVFQKSYTSKAKFLKYQHLVYTGNKLHPTQKAVMSLIPVIRTYSLPGDVVLDAFCGSGSTCAAALLTGRKYIGIELDAEYHCAASARMERIRERIAARRFSPSLIPTPR